MLKINFTLTTLHSGAAAGFTLVEVTLVMAISSLLLLGVLAGQSALQQRARFDSAVDQVIQDIAYGRNFALSNVNTEGIGNLPNVLVVGGGFELNNDHLGHTPPFPLPELEPIYASPDADGNPDPATFSNCPPGMLSAGVCGRAAPPPAICPAADHPDDADECFEQFFSLPETLSFGGTTTDPTATKTIIDYINQNGTLKVCFDVGTAYASISVACASTGTTPVDFFLTDSSGLKAELEIDPVSGLARRIN